MSICVIDHSNISDNLKNKALKAEYKVWLNNVYSWFNIFEYEKMYNKSFYSLSLSCHLTCSKF